MSTTKPAGTPIEGATALVTGGNHAPLGDIRSELETNLFGLIRVA
ncbi:MAG: hypothetical protein ACLP0L_25890 [Solirubrobacteraceae bacterium]